MDTQTLREELLSHKKNGNVLFTQRLFDAEKIEIYSRSIIELKKIIFFIAKENGGKFLYLFYEKDNDIIASKFEGTTFDLGAAKNSVLKKCKLSNKNRQALQKHFEFTNPIKVGLANSFGFGDRIGLANPAHLRALGKSGFVPILAQQSIRELTRTNRTPAEVMDAAVWAVFQEGYTDGFSADADHLKTTDDIDLMVENGFKMFTFDPGEYVHNEADTLRDEQLDGAIKNINWAGLQTNSEMLIQNYSDKKFSISSDLLIQVNQSQVKRAILKYGDALAHIKKMFDHLKQNFPNYESEVEVSVDETDSVTSPFEHLFIVSELNRLEVKLISLAPRFVGSFEKGIDYKGDLNLFKEEYLKHLAISKHFGNYKLSLHSGSDKFSVYKIIGELSDGFIHVKTAGTSYLEALKVAAIKKPELFREIIDYSSALYEAEKKSYHVSADVSKLETADKYSDKDLVELFNSDDFRQVLHVTFGKVLTDKNCDGEFIFKNRLIDCLATNEETHYEMIINHFNKHLKPFIKK